MNDRVNKSFPYQKEGVLISSKIDELMLEYYRLPFGNSGESKIHVEAYELGQKLQYYFALYSSTVVAHSIEGKKMTMPSLDHAIIGLECPFTLMLDNTFFRDNYAAVISSVLNELARMNSSRGIGKEDPSIGFALTLCKYEYLSTIALLLRGTNAQKSLDEKLRVLLLEETKKASEAMEKMFRKDDE